MKKLFFTLLLFTISVKADNQRGNVVDTLSMKVRETRTKAEDKMSWSKVGNMIGEKVKECKQNPCLIAHCSGYTTINVVAIVLPFTQIGKAGTVAQGLNAMQKLDMLGVALEKTLAVAGKAIKFTIKASNFTFKVSKAFIKPGFRLASNGKLYAVLIPLVDISPNLKAAYEKAIELISKGKNTANNLEIEHIIDGKTVKGKLTEVLEDGQHVIDENGNKLALLEVDGDKIPVLIAEDGTMNKLAQSTDEVVDDASKAGVIAVRFSSIDDLYNQFSSFIGRKGLTHIFRGEINKIGNAVGVHHISAIRAGTARIVPNTIEDLGNGFYKASVEVSDGAGGWIAKTTDKSTFFPDNWDEVKVMQEIQSAKNNMIGNPIVNTTSKLEYFGTSSSGYRIRIIIDPRYGNNPGNVLTAWFE